MKMHKYTIRHIFSENQIFSFHEKRKEKNYRELNSRLSVIPNMELYRIVHKFIPFIKKRL